MVAPLPTNERERLDALRRYQILDTDPEPELEEITRLLSQLCAMPVSLITLLDEHRQWFKSNVGLPISQTARELAFCGHAILSDGVFQVEDAWQDERFRNNGLVTGQPHIRFYAGMPLTTPDGYALGTLCVIDYRPRQLTDEQVFAIRTLARQVMTHLELRLQLGKLQQACQLLEDHRQKMLDSIHYGKRIQTAIQPTLADIQTYLPESFVYLRPRDIVSGDFYYFTEDKYTGKLIVVVADCTGHGVPGAFMSMIGSSLLNEIIKVLGITSPEEILFQLEAGIQKNLRQQQSNNQDGMEVGICVLDPENQVLEFAGARQELLLVEADETNGGQWKATVLAGDRRSIGGLQRQGGERFTKQRVTFQESTGIYLYSDGVGDQFGGPLNRKLSKKGLRELIVQHAGLPFDQQGTVLEAALVEWMADYKQIDDMLLLGFRCRILTGSMRARLLNRRKAAAEPDSGPETMLPE